MNARGPYRPAWHEIQPIPVDGIVAPSDPDAERRTIHAMISVPGFVERVHPPLEHSHFFSGANREIARGCIAVNQDGAVDAVNLIEWLKAEGKLEQVGGPRAVLGPASLSETEQREAVSAARIVWDLANRRDLALHCQQTVAAIYGNQIAATKPFLETFEQKAFEICRRSVRGSDTTTAREGFEQFLKSVIDPSKHEAISSGFPSYDAAVADMPLGEYTIIGAATGQGKTSWGLNVAGNVALRGDGVLYISTEMKAKDLMMLAGCAMANTPSIAVRRKNLTPMQQSRLIAAAARFKTLPIVIDDNFGQSLATIRSQARRAIAGFERVGKKLRLIVVDYFQDLKLPTLAKFATTEQQLLELSRGLKDLAVQTNTHVMALSQLNDNAKLRTAGERKPEMSDLKGAKGISFAAEVVAFLHREKNKEGKYEARQDVEIWVRKARFAPTDPVILTWDAAMSRFEEKE